MKDLDLFYSPEASNAQALFDVLYGLPGLRPESVPPVERLSGPRAQLKVAGGYHTELLSHIEGVSFDDAWSEAVATWEGGVSVRVLSRAHLAATKRALGRPRDLADLAALGL